MKRRWATVYAILCTLLFVGGLVVAFIFSFFAGEKETLACLISMFAGFVFVPTFHECGHLFFLSINKMECVYIKCFCFAQYIKDGKKRIKFASPFAPDQTQAMPKCGGNMKKRASAYTFGGLIFSAVLLVVLVGAGVTLALLGKFSFALWGAVPYAAYIFFLNVAPFEYPSGPTDASVYRSIKKEDDTATVMLAAMEIQGQIYAGKSFGEIDENLYFNVPQLCEDDKLFAVILELRYRYYIEKANFEKAADCLNRLVQAQEYLTIEEIEKVAAELTYMHALNGDYERAEESGKLCQNYLKENNPTAKRILAAYSAAFGKTDAAQVLIAQAQELMENERMLGVRRFEEKLLSRISPV